MLEFEQFVKEVYPEAHVVLNKGEFHRITYRHCWLGGAVHISKNPWELAAKVISKQMLKKLES